jgi:DNA adenine methylase
MTTQQTLELPQMLDGAAWSPLCAAHGSPSRPALRYYGGKWKLAPWIISHFPAHENYVEPCGGAASVLLQKNPSKLETYNDLDGNVVNYFRVLRTRTDELINAIRLTPWAREEAELSTKEATDELERARRFWVMLHMRISCSNGNKMRGMRVVTKDPVKLPELKNRDSYLESLTVVAMRLRNVQLENRPALEVIERYDGEKTLIYLDPPYVTETRSHKKEYAYEWTPEQHTECANIL